MRSSSTKAFTFLAVVGLATTQTARAGESVTSFGRVNKLATLQDLRPHLMSPEMYTEQWDFNTYLPDGTFLAINLGISNMGFGDHKAGFKARLEAPGQEKVVCQSEYDEDEWSSDKNGFALVFGKNSIKGDLGGFQLTARCDKLSMDLNFVNQAPPMHPGSGLLKFGDDGVYSMVFPSPRAKVTGKVTHQGKVIPVDGIGYAEQSYYDMAPYKQARRWFRFKAVDKDITIILAEMLSPDKYNDAQNGWAVVADDGGAILLTARVSLVFEGFVQDTKSSEGYRVPRRVRLAAVDGPNSLTGTLEMTEMGEVRDPLDDLDGFRRAIVSRFTKPRDYNVKCTYNFKIMKGAEDRTITGKGFYRFMWVNP